MNEAKCIVKNCPSVYRTEEAVSKNFRYVCAGVSQDGYKIPGHSRKEIKEALGAVYDPEKDHADEKVHFQDKQFDPELGSGKKRNGILRVLNLDDLYESQEQEGAQHGFRGEPGGFAVKA